MAEGSGMEFKVGMRVTVKDKGYAGTIRYVGVTKFAPGKWVGVELDEPKGKNNGALQGKTYFMARDNYGIFVRQNQILAIPSVNAPEGSGVSQLKKPGTGKKSPQSSPPRPLRPSKESPHLSSQEGRRNTLEAGTTKKGKSGSSSGSQTPEPTPKFAPVSAAVPAAVPDEVTDLQQRLAILQGKRAEDKAKIKELEKYKAQFNQMMEYKQKWSESQAELQQLLKIAKKEARECQLAKEKAEEELGDLSDAVEMATLDKEMAEERTESLQSENEALKEKVEELTIDLEIIKQEISESGVEGAAANAQFKQIEQQNSRLKDALVRLRDLSAQDKLEHQRVVKDLEKNASELNQLKEDRDKMAKELQESDEIIDELKEQVDIALGAEEMVEKLTDTNLELEEQLNTVTDTVTDLEALRDLSEEQEELRMEVEHELREELDLSLNSTRQVERKLDAAQECIIDQQQTIEKFRELVHNLQSDLTELRERGERTGESGTGGTGGADTQKVMNINVQLKSAIKAHARTIDFELRKLDAQQAAEHIDLLNSFMPNTFLVSGGDYDALLVLMLLPRLTFKADMLKDQLRQQHKLDEALGSLSTLTPQQADQLTFVLALVYKLNTLQLLVARATRILSECDVGLYRGVGGVRDDLNIHEKALDILIELLKKEQLDESVPLHGLDKAITHFENLLTTRLHYETPLSRGNSEDLLSRMSVLSSGCDFLSIELLRLRGAGQEGGVWTTQIKEMESFNNDLRQACRKIRRKVPAPNSRRMLRYDSTVSETLNKTGQRQQVLIDAFKALHLKASQRANSLTGSEKLTSGELEGLTREVVTSGALLVFSIEGKDPKEQLRANMTTNATSLDGFLVSLGEGIYDTQSPKSKPEAPAVVRARAVKAELSDVEGLGFKLEERQKDIMELKKALKMKGQELSESGVKVGLLDKKVESADTECAKKVGVEREEQDRLRRVMDEQERKFNKTIEILQGDIEALENDKTSLEKKVEIQSKRGILSDITVAGRRTLGGRGSPYSSPFSSPNISHRDSGSVRSAVSEGVTVDNTLQTPLLLSRIESLKKALGFSQHDNFKLKAQIAKAQLNSLPPLHVPKRLIHKRREDDDKDGDNQTDQEKSVLKRTAALIEDIKRFSLPKVISLDVGDPGDKKTSPREQLSNQVANIFEMQRQAQQLKEDVTRFIASNYPGGVITTQLASFTSPQFAKALNESTQPSVLAARLKLPLPPGQRQSCGRSHRVVVSPAQFSLLHSSVIS